MKAFKDSDIQHEEEMIEKSIHDANFQPQISELNVKANEHSEKGPQINGSNQKAD